MGAFFVEKEINRISFDWQVCVAVQTQTLRNEKKAISINADADKRQIMKMQDMILVIQNIKGSETNMLMTVKEYKEAYLFVSSLSRDESAELLKGLFDTKFSEAGKGWAEGYITANKSYYAKFCSGSDELQCFLLKKK